MSLNTKTMRERLLASTVILSALALAASTASAQTVQTAQNSTSEPPSDAKLGEAPTSAGSASGASGTVQEIVVTGSRIAGVTNLTSPSPVAVATHEDIVLSKSSTVEDVLARLPAVDFNGGISSSSNNGGAGLSEVALRNLGPQRTLILLDGERLIPSTGGSVDLNIIPLALIDHIEVLKDGASSIYGADAIGGVVNIISKRNIEGVSAEGHYGESGDGDGEEYGIDATIGMKSDRGDVMIGLGWDVRNPIQQTNRAWAVDPHADDPNYPGGSAYRSQLNVLQNENSPNQIFVNGAERSATDPTLVGEIPNVAYITALGKIKLDAGAPTWGFLTSGLDRKQLNAAAHYELTPNIKVVADGFFTDYTSQQSLRPEPLLGDTIATPEYAGFIVPSTNPYNTTGSDITGYLTPDQFGPRRYSEDSETYRLRLGFEGKFLDNFRWEFGYVFQNNSSREVVHNEGNWLHLAQLTGQVPCVDVPGGCTNGLPTTPINFFNGPNIFTPAQVAYATFDNTSISNASERYLYGDVNGTLFQLPFGPLKAAAGFESREEHYDNTPDALVQDGYGPNSQQPTSGGYDVHSIYAELQVPLLNNLPFIKAINLSPSVRFDDYSDFGAQTTYKVGADYEVTQDIRFRGAYSTAIRAPQVGELFGGTVLSDNGASGDPCETNPANSANVTQNGNFGKGVLGAGSTCSLAVAKGATVTSFHDVLDDIANNQVQVLQGGNPDLQPEKARTITGGAVVTPRWAPGLTVAVDYYSIVISNTILTGGIDGTAGADFILNGCYGPEQNKSLCSLITRDSNGNIFQINSLNTNVGVAKAQGFEYEVSYNTRAAHIAIPYVSGYFNLDLAVTNQTKNTQTNPDGSITQFNGFFNTNNETTQPRWKGIFTADYIRGPLRFRYDLRYTSHTWDLNNGVYSGVYGDAVPDLTYHDISVSYDLSNYMFVQNTRLIFGVNNLLDKDPPFIGTDSTCKCNTIAGPFDVTGRYFYGRIAVGF